MAVRCDEMRIGADFFYKDFFASRRLENHTTQCGMLNPLLHLMAGATDMTVAYLFILRSNGQIHFHIYPFIRIPRVPGMIG
jgi:hypothetical protein